MGIIQNMLNASLLSVDCIEMLILLYMERGEFNLRYYIFLLIALTVMRALNEAVWAAEVH